MTRIIQADSETRVRQQVAEGVTEWYLRIYQDLIYGPVSLADLKDWAETGRVRSGQEISKDKQNWQAVESLSDLGMEWVVDLKSRKEYGPFNEAALETLLSRGMIDPKDAMRHVASGNKKPIMDKSGEMAPKEMVPDEKATTPLSVPHKPEPTTVRKAVPAEPVTPKKVKLVEPELPADPPGAKVEERSPTRKKAAPKAILVQKAENIPSVKTTAEEPSTAKPSDSELAFAREELARLRSENDRLVAELAEKQREFVEHLDHMQSQYEATYAEQNELRHELDAIRTEHAGQLKTIEEERDTTKVELAEKIKEAVILKSASQQLKVDEKAGESAKKLEEQLQRAQAEIVRLEKKATAAESDNKDEEAAQKLKEQLKSAQVEMTILKSTSEKAQAESAKQLDASHNSIALLKKDHAESLQKVETNLNSEEELSTLNKRVGEFEKKNKELTQSLEKVSALAESDLSAAVTRSKKAEARMAELEGALGKITTERDELRTWLAESSESALNSADEVRAEMSDEVSGLEARAQKAEEAIKQARQELEKEQKAAGDTHKEGRKAEQRIAELSATFEKEKLSIQKESKRALEERDRAVTEVNKLSEKLSKAQSRNSFVSVQAEHKTALDRLGAVAAAARSDADGLRSEVSQLKKQMTAAESGQKVVRKELEQARQEAALAVDERDALTRESKSLCRKHENAVQVLEAELKDKHKEEAARAKAVTGLETRLHQADATLAGLKTRKAGSDELLGDTIAQLNSALEEAEALAVQTRKLSAGLAEERSRSKDQAAQLSALETERTTLSGRVEAEVKGREAGDAALAEREKELKKAREESQASKDRHENEVAEKSATLSARDSELADLKKIHDSVSADKVDMEKQWSAEKEQTAKNLSDAGVTIKSAQAALKDEQEKVSGQQSQLEELRGEIKRVKQALTRAEAAREASDVKHETNQKKMDAQRKQLEGGAEEDAAIRSRIDELKKRAVEMKKMVAISKAEPVPENTAEEKTAVAEPEKKKSAEAVKTKTAGKAEPSLKKNTPAVKVDAPSEKKQPEQVSKVKKAAQRKPAPDVGKEPDEAKKPAPSAGRSVPAAKAKENESGKATSPPKKNSDDEWFMKSEDNSVYGPMKLDALVKLAADCRLGPEHLLSTDKQKWVPASDVGALDLVWIVTLESGEPYGPLHPGAVLALHDEGTLKGDALITHAREGHEATVSTLKEVPEELWFLRLDDGTEYGPMTTGKLIELAESARVGPDHEVSSDKKTWSRAADMDALAMKWVVSLEDGTPFGPLHRAVLLTMLAEGDLSETTQVKNRQENISTTLAELRDQG